jgi:dGTPase
MEPGIEAATNRLKDFLYQRVYPAAHGAAEGDRVRRLVTELFRFFMDDPAAVPGGEEAAAAGRELLARRVCDHLAGMTDRFAAQQFEAHFIPRRWRADD